METRINLKSTLQRETQTHAKNTTQHNVNENTRSLERMNV
jgi:hypothetical protein